MAHRFPRRVLRPLLPLVLGPLLTLACASDPGAVDMGTVDMGPAAPAITTAQAVADFEAAWAAVRDTYFDPDFNGVDWQAVHDELLPRAAAATETEQVRNVIRDMLGRLDQSHLALIPMEALASAAPEEEAPTEGDAVHAAAAAPGAVDEGQAAAPIAGGCGLDLRFRDEELLVTHIDADGAADRAGVRMGWVLRAVGSRTVHETLARILGADADTDPREVAYGLRQTFLSRTYGPTGSSVSLTFEDANDAEVTLTLERTARDVIAHAAITSLPTFHLEFASEVLAWEGKRIAYIHFTNWFLPMSRRIDAAVDEMRDSDGFVIDLRGNGGGAAGMTMGLAGHFFDTKADLGTMRTQASVQTFRANPRRINPAGERVTPFAGPLAILVDESSASASEMFAGGMQDAGRARVFGETSMGAVLPARTTILPSGDAVLHPLGDYQTAKGVLLEGRGVIPDEVVSVRREDLLAGKDAQLEAALRWLAAQANK